MTTERRGSRATWLSLAVAGPVASALFVGSLAWASIVTPTQDAAPAAPAAPAPTPTKAHGTKAQAPAVAAKAQAPAVHTKTGASR